MRKLLVKFDQIWQADAVKSLLGQKNIAFYEIKSPREYSSIITGIGQGSVEIYVDEEEWTKAEAVLSQYKSATALHLVSEEPELAVSSEQPRKSRKNYFLFVFAILILLGIIEFIRHF